ncbi:DUF6194 family protein [Nocardia sp. 004]|uniref:DUF6194 family protein n=1 Tax=Nocardia sp. 004 TaxID=3385978 RepID=UPI0039A0594A
MRQQRQGARSDPSGPGRQRGHDIVGSLPTRQVRQQDAQRVDAVIPHPVYGPVGRLAVLNPDQRTDRTTRELLHTAYELARSRYTWRTV